jgi:hypothetical protein
MLQPFARVCDHDGTLPCIDEESCLQPLDRLIFRSRLHWGEKTNDNTAARAFCFVGVIACLYHNSFLISLSRPRDAENERFCIATRPRSKRVQQSDRTIWSSNATSSGTKPFAESGRKANPTRAFVRFGEEGKVDTKNRTYLIDSILSLR